MCGWCVEVFCLQCDEFKLMLENSALLGDSTKLVC